MHEATSLDAAASLGLALDLVDPSAYERAVTHCRELRVALPTFAQLAEPSILPSETVAALSSVDTQAPDPRNLFRVHWHNSLDGSMVSVPDHIELPSELTGVEARIVLALGNRFPMITAHKVLAAYSCLVPRIVTGRFDPTEHRAVWPSTGNYARGGVAISRIMGCRGVAVLPAGMSQERFEWLDRWIQDPDDVIRTPGTESNVKEIYDECARLRTDARNVILNQFCEFGNYLGHYHVTGPALERVFRHVKGDDSRTRLAAFVSASGSAGTLAAGDYLKDRHGSIIAAVEALECPTMLENGYGEHNIQGIGDKHIPLIHNVMNTDVVVGISDRSTDQLDVLFNTPAGRTFLAGAVGVAPALIDQLVHLGLSSICNALAAIKVAKLRGLSRDDVIVTVATDGSALYDSERARTLRRDFGGAFDERAARRVFTEHLEFVATDHMIDCTDQDRRRIFNLGYYTWVEQQGVSLADFDARRDQAFWQSIRSFVPAWDDAIGEFNARTGMNVASATMITGNPFIRYRTMLDSYRAASARGWSDADFVALVRRLDDAVAGIEGRGFTVTPLTKEPVLGAAAGFAGTRLWIKDDTGNIAGSHKGRHLFGLMLHETIAHEGDDRELVIASCGNAALAAAVVARAVDRRLRVFIPTDAPVSVVRRLSELAAITVECPRVSGERGDPCYLRFREAVAAGARPFSCQGTDAPGTIDGGRTIGLEVAEQLCDAHRGRVHLDRLFVQVGGGALASACTLGMADAVRLRWLDALPRLHAVQTQGAAPLERAWRLLRDRMAGSGTTHTVDEWIAVAAAHAGELMWPWEATPHSVAHGIVDDVTYDWLGVVEAMLRSGGSPLVVSEEELLRANDLVRRYTSIDADHTGTAGLAGLMHLSAATDARRQDQTIAVLFTGVRR